MEEILATGDPFDTSDLHQDVDQDHARAEVHATNSEGMDVGMVEEDVDFMKFVENWERRHEEWRAKSTQNIMPFIDY